MDLRHAWIALQGSVKRRQSMVKLGLLRQVSRCNEAGAGDTSAQFGTVFPFDKFEQRRLPRAIRTDQTNALTMLDLPAEILKDTFGTEDECNVGELNLDHSWFRFVRATLRGSSSI